MISPWRHHIVWPEHITRLLFILPWKNCFRFFYTHHQKHKRLACGKHNKLRAQATIQDALVATWSVDESHKVPKSAPQRPQKTPQLALRWPDTLWETAVRKWRSHKEITLKTNKFAWCPPVKGHFICSAETVGEKTHYKVDAKRQSPAACSMIDCVIKNVSGITHCTL